MADVEEVGKTQGIRLLDVFAIGPVMIFAAYKGTTLPTWARVFLGLTGGATILYNGLNYVEQEKRLEEQADDAPKALEE